MKKKAFLPIFFLSLYGFLLIPHGTHGHSGVDHPTGCRFEADTKAELFAVESICTGWGAIGVTKAISSGSVLKVSVDDSLAATLIKDDEFSNRNTKIVAETFARYSRNRFEHVRVEFLYKDRLVVAAEGAAESIKVLRGNTKTTTNCDQHVAGLPEPPFSEMDQKILSAVLNSSEPEAEVLKRVGNMYNISYKAANNSARRAHEGQFGNWGRKRDEAVKKAVACFVKRRGLSLMDDLIVTGGHVTVRVESGRLATDEIDPLAKYILSLPGISSALIDLWHNGQRVANRQYPAN